MGSVVILARRLRDSHELIRTALLLQPFHLASLLPSQGYGYQQMALLLQKGLPTCFSFQIVASDRRVEVQVLREYRLLAQDVIRIAPFSSFLKLETRLLGLPVLN